MATTQGEIRVGPQNQVKDIYVRARQKDGNTFKIYYYSSKTPSIGMTETARLGSFTIYLLYLSYEHDRPCRCQPTT